jgi:urea carboxylase
VRLYAETRRTEPCTLGVRPSALPPTARAWKRVERGSEISPWYDPMIAKLIVHGDDRGAALTHLARALADTRLAGLETNLDYLR